MQNAKSPRFARLKPFACAKAYFMVIFCMWIPEKHFPTKEFLKKTGTTVEINFKEKKLNPWNSTDYTKNWLHDIYIVTIKRNQKQFSFNFTNSKHNTDNNIKPTEYDVLACLQKYEVGTFEDFCLEFGYEMYPEYPEIGNKFGYNTKTYKTFEAVEKEYNKVFKLFGDCMDELREIN